MPCIFGMGANQDDHDDDDRMNYLFESIIIWEEKLVCPISEGISATYLYLSDLRMHNVISYD